MLKELALKYVELGHHERRLYFNETDELVAKKIRLALENGLSPLVCVGEDAAYREKGADSFVSAQIDELIAGLKLNDPSSLIIAYEPRWAIGVSQAAPPEHAEKCCSVIRERLEKHLGSQKGSQVRIIYGGSVKKQDVETMLAIENINGLFIGRTALNPTDFAWPVSVAHELLTKKGQKDK
jgi:triosephosphate isomerase